MAHGETGADGPASPGAPGGAEPLVLVDEPAPSIRRLTLNRPAKRNALSNALRGELFAALRDADADPAVRAVVIRGGGPCFSAGYDLAQDPAEEPPWPITAADGGWARHVLQGWLSVRRRMEGAGSSTRTSGSAPPGAPGDAGPSAPVSPWAMALSGSRACRPDSPARSLRPTHARPRRATRAGAPFMSADPALDGPDR